MKKSFDRVWLSLDSTTVLSGGVAGGFGLLVDPKQATSSSAKIVRCLFNLQCSVTTALTGNPVLGIGVYLEHQDLPRRNPTDPNDVDVGWHMRKWWTLRTGLVGQVLGAEEQVWEDWQLRGGRGEYLVHDRSVVFGMGLTGAAAGVVNVRVSGTYLVENA